MDQFFAQSTPKSYIRSSIRWDNVFTRKSGSSWAVVVNILAQLNKIVLNLKDQNFFDYTKFIYYLLLCTMDDEDDDDDDKYKL